MLRFWQFSAGAQAVQSFHYVMPRGHSCMLMGQKVQLGVYEGQSVSRLLSFSVRLKSEKLTV